MCAFNAHGLWRNCLFVFVEFKVFGHGVTTVHIGHVIAGDDVVGETIDAVVAVEFLPHGLYAVGAGARVDGERESDDCE